MPTGSAWGDAWGDAWGYSWGGGTVVVPDVGDVIISDLSQLAREEYAFSPPKEQQPRTWKQFGGTSKRRLVSSFTVSYSLAIVEPLEVIEEREAEPVEPSGSVVSVHRQSVVTVGRLKISPQMWLESGITKLQRKGSASETRAIHNDDAEAMLLLGMI